MLLARGLERSAAEKDSTTRTDSPETQGLREVLRVPPFNKQTNLGTLVLPHTRDRSDGRARRAPMAR